MAGLFSMQAPSPSAAEPAGDELESLDDYSGDLDEPGEGDGADEVDMAGPFDAYAETVLDAKASPEDRKAALREAIMTLIEESR
jgi:hypothetical protein